MRRMLWNISAWGIIFAMVCVSFAGIANAKIHEDSVVANTGTNEKLPDIAVAPNGTIFVAYYMDYTSSNDEIVVKKSSNYGGSYEEIGGSFSLSIYTSVHSPRIAVDGNNNLYLAYKDYVDGNTKLYVWKYTATTGQWSNLISGSVSIVSSPDIAAINDGSTNYVVISYITYETQYDLKTMVSINGGNFEEKVFRSNIQFDGGSNIRIALTHDGANLYAIVGYKDPTGQAAVVVGCYNSGAWMSDTPACFSQTSGNVVSVAFGVDGKAYAAYAKADGTFYNAYIRSAPNLGYQATWSDEQSINDVSFTSSPVVEINASENKVNVVFESIRNGKYDIMYDYATNGTDRLVNRDYTINDQCSPAICSLGDYLYVAWMHNNGADIDIRMRIIPPSNTASAYHGEPITRFTDVNGNPCEFPQFTVTDMAYKNGYVVLIGAHRVVVIDEWMNKITLDLENNDLTFLSVTIDDSNKAIIAGHTSTTSAIWTCILYGSPVTLTQVTTETAPWVDDYAKFTKVHYAEGKSCFVIASENTENSIISVNKNDLSKKNELFIGTTEIVTAMCDVGSSTPYYGYYIFTWDGTSNYIYYCSGDVDVDGYPSTPVEPANNQISTSQLAGRINDAVGYPNQIYSSPDYLRTYIAANDGVYKLMTRGDGGHDFISALEIDVDGDSNADAFDYFSIAYHHTSGKLVAVGGADLDGDSSYENAVAVVLLNVENNPITEAFYLGPHTGGFRSVAMKNEEHMYIGGSYQIVSFDYYGYETLELNVQNEVPIVTNFKVDYASVNYASARYHAQLEPTGANAIAIWAEVVDPNAREEITTVTLQAWHDEDGTRTWPGVSPDPNDRNGVLQITYDQSLPIGSRFTLDYPTTGEVILGTCTETDINEYTKLLKFVFTPGKQARYGLDGGGSANDDACTWNVQFVCDDLVGSPQTSTNPDWEFGYTKVTSLGGVVTAQVPGQIAPGSGDGTPGDTNALTITWSSNWKYKVSVEMTSALYHAGPPSDTIPERNVLVAEASSFTPGYSPNTFTTLDNYQGIDHYYGFDHGNPVYWYGSSGGYSPTAPPTGNEQSFQTRFRVYVQYGTMAGSYTANLQYVVDIA